MTKHLALLTAVCVGFVVAAPADARLLDSWPYNKLMKESDLVVIAKALKTEAANDKPPDHHWPNEFVGQNTTFQIAQAMKGKAKDETIRVFHFKFGDLKKGIRPGTADSLIIDGPMFVTFRPDKVVTTEAGMRVTDPGPDYLLFLKALKDGRYEPVSGQIDPALSVRELSRPRKAAPGEK